MESPESSPTAKSPQKNQIHNPDALGDFVDTILSQLVDKKHTF
jgi:hypothetical protein